MLRVLGQLTFDTGLNLPVPLPAAVAKQRERRLLVAHDVPLGANVQQLIPHFKAGVAVQDRVGGRMVGLRRACLERKKEMRL